MHYPFPSMQFFQKLHLGRIFLSNSDSHGTSSPKCLFRNQTNAVIRNCFPEETESTNVLQKRFQKMQMLNTFEVDLQALIFFLYTCFYAVMCTGTGSLCRSGLESGAFLFICEHLLTETLSLTHWFFISVNT